MKKSFYKIHYLFHLFRLNVWNCSFHPRFKLQWTSTFNILFVSSSVSNFQKASGALYIAIFFDTTCQEYPFLGHGYVLRGTVGEGPKGVESIPPIFAVPLVSSWLSWLLTEQIDKSESIQYWLALLNLYWLTYMLVSPCNLQSLMSRNFYPGSFVWTNISYANFLDVLLIHHEPLLWDEVKSCCQNLKAALALVRSVMLQCGYILSGKPDHSKCPSALRWMTHGSEWWQAVRLNSETEKQQSSFRDQVRSVRNEGQIRNNAPEGRGQSANEFYPVCTYINHLVMTTKGNSWVDRPEASLVILALLDGAESSKNRDGRPKALERATTINDI